MKESSVVLVDGECVLCDGFVQFVAKYDNTGCFFFETQQSHAGQQILKLSDGQHPLDLKSIILVESDGKKEEVYTKSTAVLRILSQLPIPWSLFRIFLFIPSPLRDWVYTQVAENRYRLFGRKDVCNLPENVVRQRILRSLND